MWNFMKMKYIFLILLFSFKQSTYAIDLDPSIINILDDINQQSMIKNYANEMCNIQLISKNNYSIHTLNQLFNECAVSLCGAPTKNQVAYLSNSNFQQYVNPEIKKKLDDLTPALNQVLDKSKKNNLLVADSLEKISNNGKVTATPELWSEWFKQELSFDIFSKYFYTTIDLNKPIDQRFALQINSNAKKLPPEFINALTLYAKEYEDYVKNDPFIFLQKGLFTISELKLKANSRLAYLKRLYVLNLSKIPTKDSIRISSDIFGVELNLKKNPVSTTSLFYYLNKVEIGLNSAVRPNLVTQTKKPTCSDKIVCQKIYQDYLDKYNLSQVIQNFKADLNNPKAKNRSLNQCKATLTAKLNQYADAKKASELFNEVKNDLDVNVFSKFSIQSRNLLNNYLANNILIVTEDYDIYGKAPTDLTLEMKQSITNYLNRNVPKLPTTQEEALKRILIMGDNAHQVDAFMDTGSPCNSKPQLLATDSYVARSLINKLSKADQIRFAKGGSNDLMFVSEFTCRNELRGKAIMAHELGHAINNIFLSAALSNESTQRYKLLRKCVTDNYIQIYPSSTKNAHPGDSVYTEEDQADLLSFMIYKDNKDLFSCSFLPPTRDEMQYGKLSLDLSISEVHSTNLYRLIMDMINKEMTIPTSCQNIIDSESSRFRFEKCAI